MKFTAVEAEAIRPFVENSPLFAWMYPVFGVQGLSNLLEATEILVGLLIAARPWSPPGVSRRQPAGSRDVPEYLSFLVTTPGA